MHSSLSSSSSGIAGYALIEMISAEKNHFFHQESEEVVGLVDGLELIRSLSPL